MDVYYPESKLLKWRDSCLKLTANTDKRIRKLGQLHQTVETLRENVVSSRGDFIPSKDLISSLNQALDDEVSNEDL